MMPTFDYLVLGSGSAGLSFALRVCQKGRVALVTKKERTDSNTNWAQGGIAGVMAADDNTELHVQDTLIAGRGAVPGRRGARAGDGGAGSDPGIDGVRGAASTASRTATCRWGAKAGIRGDASFIRRI